ncbi:MAG: metallophosphoesterase [SAR324 cluster bacterium]|nr:metallophosphoesterase [SAR324 cluster bacterium]
MRWYGVIVQIFLLIGFTTGMFFEKWALSSEIRQTLVIAATSDQHGWLSTKSVFPDEPIKGILHIAPILQELRQAYPHLILLDAGDTLQGSPSNYYFNYHSAANTPLPVIQLMNHLKYDAVVLGNHDFEPLPHVLQRNIRFSDFPWLAANVVSDNRKIRLLPYHLIEKEGIRIGILGLLTPGTSMWVDRAHLAGFSVEDMVESARHWGHFLKEQERVDLLIGVFHSGHNLRYDQYAALNQGVSLPNAAGVIADSQDVFDLIISGHAHQTYPKRRTSVLRKFRIPVISPGFWAAGVSVAKLMLQKKGGQWTIENAEYEFIEADPAASPELLAQVEKEWQDVQKYLHEETLFSFIAKPAKGQFYQCGTSLSHAVVKQLGAESDLSLLPGRWRWKSFAKQEMQKPLQRLHLFRWLPHDNFLVQAQLYGRQIEILLKPYLRRQQGMRSSINYLIPGGLSMFPENPLSPQQLYPVWMTNYHWNGGRGMKAEALLHSSQKQQVAAESLRDLVFLFLQDPSNELPAACLAFLGRSVTRQTAFTPIPSANNNKQSVHSF